MPNKPFPRKRSQKPYKVLKIERIERALRAENRAKYDASFTPAQHRYATSEARRQCLSKLLREVGVSLPQAREAHLLVDVQFALAELAGYRRRRPEIEKRRIELLTRLNRASTDFRFALFDVYKDAELRDSVNEILNKVLFQFFKPFLKSEDRPIPAPKDFDNLKFNIEYATLIGVPARFQAALSVFISEMANSFDDTKRLNYVHHEFVRKIAEAWHRETNDPPSLSRTNDVTNAQSDEDDESNKKYRTKFQVFLEKIVKKDAIGSDIIRSVDDAFKMKMGVRSTKSTGQPPQDL
jgi:hypothetical protein